MKDILTKQQSNIHLENRVKDATLGYTTTMTDFWTRIGRCYIVDAQDASRFTEDPIRFIRTQHGDLFTMIKKLRKAVKRHILDEEALLDMRETNRPKNHIDVTEKLEKHKTQHESFVKSLEELEKMFEKHIQDYDKIHIHRL